MKYEIDQKIWVTDDPDKFKWLPRHFAKEEGGMIYAWDGGQTSHSVKGNSDVPEFHYVSWRFATDKNPYEVDR